MLTLSWNTSKPIATDPSSPLTCAISHSDWLHRLRVVEQLRRIINRLEVLQPGKALSIIRLTRSRSVQPRVGVVDVHSPVIFCQRCCDVGHPVVEEIEAIGWVRAEEDRVVELDQVELVSVGVGGCAEVAVGDGGVRAAWVCVSLDCMVSLVWGLGMLTRASRAGTTSFECFWDRCCTSSSRSWITKCR